MSEERLIGLDLSITSTEVIAMLLDSPSDEGVYREILEANRNRPEVLQLLYENPRTPDDVYKDAAELLSLPVVVDRKVTPIEEEEPHEEVRMQKAEKILHKVQHLSIGEKIQLALKGGKELRSVLIRDPNKEVVMKVLENPKLTEGEVEMIAKNPSVPEDALRYIAKKRDWVRRYPIIVSLVNNPKTPPGVAMPFISHLRFQDLVILEKNKNVTDAVRNAAKRYVRMRKK
ncbi:MAG: hypothetical protein D6726_03805 [Nitrospirae bacterium]|nr:MAG: hypothetical protein D6726_03805 [Nitrospirota bacterium]